MSFANNALDLCIKVIEDMHRTAHPDCPSGSPSHAAMDAALSAAREALAATGETCPMCDGDGEIHSHNPRCPRCKGRGWIEKEPECPICGGDDEKLFPNLDDISDDDREHYADVFRGLVAYCEAKTKACEARLEGEITHAVYLEHICEEIYNRLPKWARW